MRTAFRCRAYPTPEQAANLSRTFGCVRKVWNETLAWRHQRWYGEHVGTNVPEANVHLTAMKRLPEYAYLFEVSSVPLQQVLRTQQKAFANFFARRARYPRFKNRNGRQSAEYTRSAFRWRDGTLTLAKQDAPLAFVWSWPGIDPATLNPSTVTVSRDPDGRWYVSLSVDVDDPVQPAPTGAVVGLDLGLKDHDVIVVADLAVKNMVRNPSLAKAISDSGWGALRRLLEYKTAKAGKHLIVIDRWYPSSKTCSACGHLLAELSLGTRHWTCPTCRTRHDRDENAAKNILAAGLAVAASGGDACGGDVRHSGSSRVQSPTKQELPAARPRTPVLQGGE